MAFLFLLLGAENLFFGASIASLVLISFQKIKFLSRLGEGTPLRSLFLFLIIFSCFHFFHFFHFPIFPFFFLKNVFLFSLKMPLLTFVTRFNKRSFLRSRCSMEMWCLDDIGRGSWDWVGGEYASTPQSGVGGSSPVKTEPPQIGLLLLALVVVACRTQPQFHHQPEANPGVPTYDETKRTQKHAPITTRRTIQQGQNGTNMR